MKKNKVKDKKILIIGGAGFIGHNLALKLKEIGADVCIIDGLTINNLYSLEKNENKLPYPKLAMKILNERQKLLKKARVPLHIEDARKYNELSALVNVIKPKVVIHLAAVSHANRSNKDPHSTFDHSLRTLENALDNVKNNVEHFIFLSSSMVYGNFKKQEVNENDICEPIGIYGALKYSAEKIIKAYNQTFNLPYTILRPSALYGERCISRRVGQIFIESALNNTEIKIQGDGNEKLDFTYIEDLVGGIINVLESKNSINETFNITFGQSRSTNTLLEILKKEFKDVKVSYEKRDKLMPIRGTLSTAKAIKLIGYSSKWPLENGYPRYVQWYKKIFQS
jgi:nucleoside-diphosphate-sugar epimerase